MSSGQPRRDRAEMRQDNPERFRLVAPVSHPDEVAPLCAAGADEFYCGVLPASWSSRYGAWDNLTRRQGNVANLSSLEQLREVAALAHGAGRRTALTLNVRYTAGQISDLLQLAGWWEEAGGAAAIISSVPLMLALRGRGPGLRRHVSLLANVMNGRAATFFAELGADRVILPRDLTIEEMAAVISSKPDLEYEAMALNEKCRYIDGLCNFYHGTTYPENAASLFDYERAEPGGVATTRAHDLCYAGHGCQVPFRDEDGAPIAFPLRDDENQPACAACHLRRLHRAGVRWLKIGGRGLPLDLKLRAVAFLRDAADRALAGATAAELRMAYRRTFGRACGGDTCYYAPAARGGA